MPFSLHGYRQVVNRALVVLKIVVVVGDTNEEGCRGSFSFGGGAAAGIVEYVFAYFDIAHRYWGSWLLVDNREMVFCSA